MYCRKCIREKEEEINMEVDTEEKCYICPECGHIVSWISQEEE